MEDEAGLALAHRRLAVIDLSPAGHQPMLSGQGGWAVVFNGEIYNFHQLRELLEPRGHHFRGGSDTEVLLAALEEWGLPGALEGLVGMFAFAAWDRRQRRLWLVRDRLGKKPLYWMEQGGVVAFASELKGLFPLPQLSRRWRREALPHFLRFGYLSPPAAALEGVYALPAGGWANWGEVGEVTAGRYWDIGRVIARARQEPFRGSLAEAAEAFEAVLAEAVRLRLVADVPLGAFLSGGLDSTLITALMQRQVGRPVRTFTVGFAEVSYDESRHAQGVARHLGTDHTSITLTEAEALEVVPRLPEMYDEPFADSSQIPTFLVAREARRHVTVALTGDGGDELLGGYERYRVIAASQERFARLPVSLRRLGGQAALIASHADHPWWLFALAPLLAVRGRRLASLRERFRRRALLLGALDPATFYDLHGAACLNPEPEVWLLAGAAAPRRWREVCPLPLPPVETMMALDFAQYLPDDILVKVDRASMAVALETRCPLLDHRVVEFAWRLPADYKWDGQRGKVVLRRLLARYVPEALWERPKMGFGMPVGEWLGGALRDWAEELLAPGWLAEAGVWRVAALRRAWREHLEGRHDHRNLLWPVLMFEAWRRHWRLS